MFGMINHAYLRRDAQGVAERLPTLGRSAHKHEIGLKVRGGESSQEGVNTFGGIVVPHVGKDKGMVRNVQFGPHLGGRAGRDDPLFGNPVGHHMNFTFGAAPGNGPGARLRIGDEGFHGRREVGQGIAGPEDDAPMGDAGQSAMAPEKPPPCHPFDRLVVEGVDDGGRCGIGREKPFDKGPLAAFLGGEGPPERIIAHAGQFPERRIVGKAERHVMAAFAQPPGLIDGLPGASAAVVGPCDDDDAHT